MHESKGRVEPGADRRVSIRGNNEQADCSARLPETTGWWLSSNRSDKTEHARRPNSHESTSTSTQVLKRRAPDLVTLCCPTRNILRRRLRQSRPVSRSWSRSLSCSTSRRPNAYCWRRLSSLAVFRHQFQPPVCRPVRRARASDRERKLGLLVFATSEIRKRGRDERDPQANLIEDPMSRLRHARTPLRPDRERDDSDGRQPHRSRELDHGHRFEILRGAVGSLVGSYDSSYAMPNTHYLEVNGTGAGCISKTRFVGTSSARPETRTPPCGKRVLQRSQTGSSMRCSIDISTN